ncbi:MAG: sulfatase-like hydrolase/transferase [Patescibacteria group bacterium]|jgi:hypothetical protein
MNRTKLINKVKKYFSPLYPWLYLLYTLLLFTGYGIHFTNVFYLALNLIIAGIGLFVLMLILGKFTSDRAKIACITLVFEVIYFNYKAFEDWALTLPASDILFKLHLPVLLTIAVLIFFSIKVIKFSKPITAFTKVATFVVIILVLDSLYVVIDARAKDYSLRNRVENSVTEYQSEDKPDIYYIIYDRYTGSKALKNLYGYDNSAFTDELKKRGFYYADKSSSNYFGTLHSLTSIMNMDFNDSKASNDLFKDSDLLAMLDNNRVTFTLQKMGYSTYNVGSWWTDTNRNPNMISPKQMAPMTLMDYTTYYLLRGTLAEPLKKPITNYQMKHVFNYRVKSLDEIKNNPSPKFVFMHSLSSHTPFVYDAKCNIKSDISQESVEIYLDNLQCVNQHILQIVDTILNKPGDKPVIILQSDEGHEITQALPTTTDAPDAALLEKFSTLSTFYFPDQKYDQLYPEISSVNTFRVVLNKLFNANIALLPDKSYVSGDQFEINDTKEVTNRISELIRK